MGRLSVPPEVEIPRGTGLAPAFGAVRTRRALVALLLVLAVAGWWWTFDQMRGMDNGPWTGFGPLGWFLGVWVVMMAAMMFPSVAPTVALYSRMTRRRSFALPLLFAAGYLLAWTVAGALAFAIRDAINATWSGALAWDHGGRWAAGVTLVIAAIYQVTPLKDACLGKCRSPLGLLLGSWREGNTGALRMGIKNGAWCVGCCWALMAALIALGVMSVVWMAVVAALIAFEKTVPSRRLASGVTTAILLGLGLLLLIAPGAIPGLTTPSSPMHDMRQMGDGRPVMGNR